MKKMLRRPIAAFGILLFVITLVLVGCRKNLSNELQKDDPSDDLEMYARRIGVDPSSIKDSGNFIIVGGDMLIPKKEILATTSKRQVVATTANSTPAWSGGPISPGNRGDIKIYITTQLTAGELVSLPPGVLDRYESAVRRAIDNFNTLIPFTSIKMREVLTRDSSDIVVHLVGSLPGNPGGLGYYPVNGSPGAHVYLNLSRQSGYPSVAAATLLATHELGHTIGLFHTDEIPASSFTETWDWGFFYLKRIPGTPDFATASNPHPDPESFILQSTYAGPEWTQTPANPTGVGFSDNDVKAIQYLYPLFEISGSSSFCNSATYTISDLPTGATVNWSNAYSGIATLTTSGNTATLSTNAGGALDLTATVTIGSSTINLSRNVISRGVLSLENSGCYAAFFDGQGNRCFKNDDGDGDISITLTDIVDPYTYGGTLFIIDPNVVSMSLSIVSKNPSNAVVSASNGSIRLKGSTTSAVIRVTYSNDCGASVSRNVYVRAPNGQRYYL